MGKGGIHGSNLTSNSNRSSSQLNGEFNDFNGVDDAHSKGYLGSLSFDGFGSKNGGYMKTVGENISPLSECHSIVNSPSKINDNATGAGVLRYALHLRFLCPFSKKCSRSVQRCKSEPFSAPARNKSDLEGERRFYLYNDLRVVFPQRHSDTDEGKVCEDAY